RRLPASAAGDVPASTVVEILNDDMPFLVDSAIGEIRARGLDVSLLQHPIFRARRDKAGRLQEIAALDQPAPAGGNQESYIAIHLPALSEAAASDLVTAISAILVQVRIVVDDWKPMLQRLRAATGSLELAPPNIPPQLLVESVAFLSWLERDN